jgi:superfamily II DNA/RNA helicase
MFHGGRSFAAPAARAGPFDGEGERAPHTPGHDAASDLDAAAVRAWGALHPLLKRSVVQLGLTEPTEIQRMSLSKNVAPQWRDSLLLAETGSGKTLAYLLPTLHRLKQIEEETAARARPRRPRALVVVPTRELGEQVLSVAKTLSHVAKFSATGVFGGGSRSQQASALAHGCDLLVATPMRLVSLAENGLLHFGDVRAVAVDEADTILAQGFRQELEKILVPVRAAAEHANRLHQELHEHAQSAALSEDQLRRAAAARASPFHIKDRGRLQIVLVAATVSTAVKRLALTTVPSALTLQTSGLHRVPPSITQKFIDVSAVGQREGLLQQGTHFQSVISTVTSHSKYSRALTFKNLCPVRQCLRLTAKAQQRSSGAGGCVGVGVGASVRGGGAGDGAGSSIMIFCNTKSSCSFVHEQLKAEGIAHASIHGDLSKDDRFVQMNMFASGHVPILVLTNKGGKGLGLTGHKKSLK